MAGLSLAGILGVQGLGLAAPVNPAPPVPPPSLATAAEMLSERKLFEACDVVIKLGLASLDTTENERVRLHLVLSMQRAGASDKAGAQSAIAEALQFDRGAQMPAFASPDARRLLEDVRAKMPPAKPKSRPGSHMVYPGNGPPQEVPDSPPPSPAPARPPEGPAKALTRAVDALYGVGSFLEAAGLLLDLANRAQPLSREDQAQLALRRGILFMEEGEQGKAASAFGQAQELDPKAQLPDYRPPKTLKVFDDVRRKLALIKPKEAPVGTPVVHPPILLAQTNPDVVSSSLMVGGGVALGVGILALVVSSVQDPAVTAGQVAGGVIAVAGIATIAGGSYVSARPEVLAFQVGVAPIDRGGVLVAAGRF